MTKIALCISGQARSWEKCLNEYVKPNLLDIYDVDVFFHTWKHPKLDINKLYDAYKPVSGIIEEPLLAEPINLEYPRVASLNIPAIQTYSMYYSMYQAWNLAADKHYMRHSYYDWIVRTRFDYALNGVIEFEKLNNKLLYVPNCRMTPNKDFCNDQFAYGSYNVMLGYSSVYPQLNKYYNEGVIMNGEDMMAANLKFYELAGTNLEYVNMNNPFPPGLYNGTSHSLIRDDIGDWQK